MKKPPGSAAGKEESSMTTPRLRTAEGALAIIKAEDPQSAVTLRHIRRLIATGTVPHVPVGRKKLVNMDALLTYLESGNH